MIKEKPYTILVLMNATPAWLSLSRDDRSKFFEKAVAPAFVKAGESVRVRMFDSEYFNARVSDFLVIETMSLDNYKLLIELLRDTKIYSEPYFQIVEIIPGQENLFEDFNEQFKREGR
jgi:hypothetical protein